MASAIAALAVAEATTRAMSAEEVTVYAVPQQFASADDLWPNFGRLLTLIVQLTNGGYFFAAPLGARSVLFVACAALVLLAVAAPFLLVRRELRSAETSVPLLVHAFFWTSCIVFSGASFMLSSKGTHPGFYMIPVLYAAAGTVLYSCLRRQLAGSLRLSVPRSSSRPASSTSSRTGHSSKAVASHACRRSHPLRTRSRRA